MKNLAELLESELENAFEVKNKKSLHNYVSILVNSILEREEINKRFLQISNEIKLLSETVKLGFENVNRRFEDMNKRFEDMNKRFDDTNKKINILIWVFTIWMTLFSGLSVFLKLYQ
ncbi:MAG: hypothetical protein D6813_03150 [Calditrichaeota bacterium]|nr:MAG: hypothetical protein D6813_03150 [Calditrichota bacterium]